MTLLIISILSASLVVMLAALTWLFFAYFRKLDPSSLPDNQLPFVSVIVPARNEGGKIGRCLESLAKQNYPNYEVIAVDDRSTDETGAIIKQIAARYPHVRFVCSDEAKPGWIGKCNALVSAEKYANGKWYLFTDADTCHSENSLRYSLSYALKNSAELISFMPIQELGSFWERVVMPVLLGSFLCGDPLNTINERTNDRAYAYGQYILVRSEIYNKVGGHAAVYDQILDDISFARLVKDNGYHVMAADGKLLYRVRMYTNLVSLWHGWTKNLYALIECKMIFLVLVICLINICILFPFIQAGLVAYMWLSATSNTLLLPLTLLSVLQMSCLLAWYKRTTQCYLGVNLSHFLLLPFGSLVVTVLYLHSAYLVLSGNKVSWKGRRYVVNTAKSIEPESEIVLTDMPSLGKLSAFTGPLPLSVSVAESVIEPELVSALAQKNTDS
jgi:chlorobactene glucosyltransferase